MVSEPSGSVATLRQIANGDTPSWTHGLARSIRLRSWTMKSVMLDRRQSANDRPSPYSANSAASSNAGAPATG